MIPMYGKLPAVKTATSSSESPTWTDFKVNKVPPKSDNTTNPSSLKALKKLPSRNPPKLPRLRNQLKTSTRKV